MDIESKFISLLQNVGQALYIKVDNKSCLKKYDDLLRYHKLFEPINAIDLYYINIVKPFVDIEKKLDELYRSSEMHEICIKINNHDSIKKCYDLLKFGNLFEPQNDIELLYHGIYFDSIWSIKSYEYYERAIDNGFFLAIFYSIQSLIIGNKDMFIYGTLVQTCRDRSIDDMLQIKKYTKLLIMHEDFAKYNLKFRKHVLNFDDMEDFYSEEYHFESLRTSNPRSFNFKIIQIWIYSLFDYFMLDDPDFCRELIDYGLTIKITEENVNVKWISDALANTESINPIMEYMNQTLIIHEQIKYCFHFEPKRYVIKNYSQFMELSMIQHYCHVMIDDIFQQIIPFLFI